MSFSSDIKIKTASIMLEHIECAAAELSGMVRFGGKSDSRGIRLYTENEIIKNRVVKDVTEVFGFSPLVTRYQRSFRIIIADENQAENVSDMLFLESCDFERLTDELIPFDCCAASFIRGAFLNGGSISDPAKAYHMEFTAKRYEDAEFLMKLLGSYGYYSKIAPRKNSTTVYMKECDAIAEILGFMGAGFGALELYSVQAEKSLRNSINRQVNCETANAKKTASAALKHIVAIEKLKKSGQFPNLPDTLKEIAGLRLEYPEMSLKELGAMTDPPVGRSGVNHRLERLIALADLSD